MARRKRKFATCPKNKFRFLTPSLCSVCDSIEKCSSFNEFYQKNKKKYNKFVYETIHKFPEKYQLEVIFMATKQVFIQIVDKKSGKIEEVISSKTLEALDIEKKIALTKGKELFIVTHKVEPVIKIEMKQVKISEPITYIEPEQGFTLEIDESPKQSLKETVQEIDKKTPKKRTPKAEKQTEEIVEEVVEKKRKPRKKKTD